ncbi:hypothetical protein [Paenibacillus thalictri]|uniref:Uncharacterized protein n=1 Tax=Paenibacillus thalictri TaxID=2527873 RepID=A0A4Q9DDQ8_9BACL|nr:hypothetical protein [Paenibacillus thalictri]TBL69320.1 hypothetical protein EYB31_36275 [Paenibacillus thalictri]
MILYQLAKWMEQRTRISETIALSSSNSDADALLSQKEQIKERMLMHPSEWHALQDGLTPFAEEPEQMTLS